MVTLSEIKELGAKKDQIDTTWRRKISYPITLVLIKLRFTGNGVSVFGLVIGLLSCIFFIKGDALNFSIGGILLFFSQIMDYCDGEVARYRTAMKLPDERWRNKGGAFDSLNHISPTPALICMGVGLGPELIFAGIIAGIFQFIRGGFFSYASFALRKIGKKFTFKKQENNALKVFLPHMELGFLFPHMVWLALLISITALIEIITNIHLILDYFIIISVLIFTQGLLKIMVNFPRIENIKNKEEKYENSI